MLDILPPDALAAAHVPTDPKVEQLSQLFPELEKEILLDILASLHGDLEAAVNSLIEESAEEVDASMCRRLQHEQDAEVAQAIHASLQAEMKQEEDERKKKEFPAVAARAVNNASSSLKSLLQAAQRKVAAQRASGRNSLNPLVGTSSTHEVRLLDAPLESDTYDMSPLSPAYTPPLVTDGARESPPATPPDVDASASVLRNSPETSTSSKYSSRMDRARQANRQRTQSRSVPPASEASVEPLRAPVAVPEGQLI